MAIGDRIGLDGAALAKASRLVAKADSAAVQNGFNLYLRAFIVTDDGRWVVVQQGMDCDTIRKSATLSKRQWTSGRIGRTGWRKGGST